MTYPRLIINKAKLKYNIDKVTELCHSHGIKCFVVTKVTCANPIVTAIIENSKADGFADSRLSNLSSIKTNKPKLMLRIASPDEAEELVETADISLQSSLDTIIAVERAAERKGCVHRIILMIDLGDLREGIFFEDRQRIIKTAEYISKASNLELFGIGTNLTCYGAILPDEDNLCKLIELTKWLRIELNEDIPLISGGNSSSLGMLLRNELPHGINHLRIGEGIMLGQDTASCTRVPFLYDDAFTLEAQIVEVYDKPSKPIGTAYKNAFGEQVSYPDKGIMKRAILAIGRQDVCFDGLFPIDESIEILGGSSDHLLVNLTKATDYGVGDVLTFKLNYGALLSLCTSKYVLKTDATQHY